MPCRILPIIRSVINGCSDLLIDVFGEAGQHARSAVGFGSLPGNITVEIEAIISLEGLRSGMAAPAHHLLDPLGRSLDLAV